MALLHLCVCCIRATEVPCLFVIGKCLHVSVPLWRLMPITGCSPTFYACWIVPLILQDLSLHIASLNSFRQDYYNFFFTSSSSLWQSKLLKGRHCKYELLYCQHLAQYLAEWCSGNSNLDSSATPIHSQAGLQVFQPNPSTLASICWQSWVFMAAPIRYVVDVYEMDGWIDGWMSDYGEIISEFQPKE